MSRIRKLPEDLVLKIAAGEVIERPFSVVKELVENSLDAGARSVQVTVEDGGRKSIIVQDDGMGMTREEVALALERHATSKLPSEEDLFRIKTLGFRGEALPSIAAVSFMTLESRSGDEEVGTKLEIEGGRPVKSSGSALPRGTRIVVRNLFFNTPARLKFLKSRETEFSHIAGWMEAAALSRPDVTFHLLHNGKTELRAQSTEERRVRVGEVLGAGIAEFLHPVYCARSGFRLTGMVSDHRAGSGSARSLFFFVNGRHVRDRTLQHAVLSAYETLLMKHRYPWAVLYLDVPPELVDVNVHPTKSEVRFANGSLVHEFVREGVRSVLRQEETGSAEVYYAGTSENEAEKSKRGSELEIDARRNLTRSDALDFAGRIERVGGYTEAGPVSSLGFPSLRILGQVHGTYLLCETPDTLILIDQHAAHERIGFEELKAQLEKGEVEKQQLLIPQNFDLRPSQGEILKKYLEELGAVGLEIEFFGGNTFILRSIPVLLMGTDIVELVGDLIDSLQSVGKLTPLRERIHDVLERMACHRQVRAGDRLSVEEISALIETMKTSPHAGQCPHGRPSILSVPFDDVEKWFKRKI